MKIFLKTVLFLFIFTAGFFLLRQTVYYNIDLLASDLGGVTYLYSTVGVIFAIFAAFVILFEAERWNSLVDAVKGEAGELKELWLWSRHLPKRLQENFNEDIKQYLEVLIKEEWTDSEKGQKNKRMETALQSLHLDIYKILREAPDLMATAFSTFSDLIRYREKRIHYAAFGLPRVLKGTLIFSDVLVIALSFLIAVHNQFLAYLFVGSIATLGYVIYLLIDDMDHPTRPGGWRITTKDYEELLGKIKV